MTDEILACIGMPQSAAENGFPRLCVFGQDTQAFPWNGLLQQLVTRLASLVSTL